MRGKVHKMNHSDLCSRITPAYAGKRHSLFHSTEVEQDHPRLCGEKPKPTPTTLTIMGSPPPMRGKALAHSVAKIPKGITPAYAGKSTIPEDLSSVFWDHPRLCGEKAGRAAAAKEGKGSPPPMRGKDAHDIYDRYKKRITPAYAGKRSSRCSAMHRRRDHPRLCGEKNGFLPLDLKTEGSPPPMRGKDQSLRPRSRCCRITPAYAGKRSFRR